MVSSEVVVVDFMLVVCVGVVIGFVVVVGPEVVGGIFVVDVVGT